MIYGTIFNDPGYLIVKHFLVYFHQYYHFIFLLEATHFQTLCLKLTQSIQWTFIFHLITVEKVFALIIRSNGWLRIESTFIARKIRRTFDLLLICVYGGR